MSGALGAVAVASQVLAWINAAVTAGTGVIELGTAVKNMVGDNRGPSQEEWALVFADMDLAEKTAQNAVDPTATSTVPT